jgi:hypothetical protein
MAAHPNAVISLVPGDLKLAPGKPLVETDFVARVLPEPSGRWSPAVDLLLSMIYDSEFDAVTLSFTSVWFASCVGICMVAVNDRLKLREAGDRGAAGPELAAR